MCVRVLMFSDQPIVAIGMQTILMSSGKFLYQSVHPRDSDLLSAIECRRPHILTLDFKPETDLMKLVSLHDSLPSSFDLKTVLLVRRITPDLAHQAIELGVRGILPPTSTAEQTVSCLNTVASGDYWFGEELKSSLYRFPKLALSPRESQLVILVSQGLKNKEIARVLGISSHTVRTYLSSVFRKLGLKDRYELALCGTRKLLGIELKQELTFPGIDDEKQFRKIAFARRPRGSGDAETRHLGGRLEPAHKGTPENRRRELGPDINPERRVTLPST